MRNIFLTLIFVVGSCNASATTLHRIFRAALWENPVNVGNGIEVALIDSERNSGVTFVLPRVRMDHALVWFAANSASDRLCELLSQGAQVHLRAQSIEATPADLRYSQLYWLEYGVVKNIDHLRALQQLTCY